MCELNKQTMLLGLFQKLSFKDEEGHHFFTIFYSLFTTLWGGALTGATVMSLTIENNAFFPLKNDTGWSIIRA